MQDMSRTMFIGWVTTVRSWRYRNVDCYEGTFSCNNLGEIYFNDLGGVSFKNEDSSIILTYQRLAIPRIGDQAIFYFENDLSAPANMRRRAKKWGHFHDFKVAQGERDGSSYRLIECTFNNNGKCTRTQTVWQGSDIAEYQRLYPRAAPREETFPYIGSAKYEFQRRKKGSSWRTVPDRRD